MKKHNSRSITINRVLCKFGAFLYRYLRYLEPSVSFHLALLPANRFVMNISLFQHKLRMLFDVLYVTFNAAHTKQITALSHIQRYQLRFKNSYRRHINNAISLHYNFPRTRPSLLSRAVPPSKFPFIFWARAKGFFFSVL